MLINTHLTKKFYNLENKIKKGSIMEPSMDQIEDYHGNESKEKRKIVYIVIACLLAIGLGYTLIKNSVDANMPNSFIPYQR